MNKPIAEWSIIPGYICNECGGPARENPDDKREWGCSHCNGSTHSVALNFTKLRPEDYIAKFNEPCPQCGSHGFFELNGQRVRCQLCNPGEDK